MSETRDILTDVVADRESVFGDSVKNLRTGQSFQAEIQAVSDMELNAALGRDPRESVTLHVRDDASSAGILLNDIVTALGSRFRILRRSDNPLSIQTEFGAMKVTAKDT